MASEWRKATFAQLCDIKRGASPRPIQDWVAPEGVPWIKISDANASSSRFITKTRERIKEAGRDKSVVVYPGDLILSNSATPGIPKFLGIEACIHDGWLLLRNFRGLDKTFAYYLLLTQRDALVGQGNGSVFTNLKTEILKNHEVTIPALPEQRRIAALLGEIDDKLELMAQTNATLEAIAQALFKSWFVDFDPVRAKAEGREPEGMNAATAALFPSEFEDSELGPIPKGWHVQALIDAFDINPKRALKKGTVAKYLDMASVPTIGHVPDAPVDRVFASGSKFTNGDTLLARITPCLENGKTAHVDFLDDGESAWGSTEFIVLRPRAPLPSYFGYLIARQIAFRTFAIQAMSGTSGRQRVELGRLEQFRLTVPDERIAIRFGDIVEPLRQSISANAERAKTLASLRDTLLPRLISGKLRLPEAKNSLEDAFA